MLRGLYRGLMYAARPLDAQPALRALLARPCAHPQCHLSPHTSSSTTSSTSAATGDQGDWAAAAGDALQGLWDEVLGRSGAVCYSPPPPTMASPAALPLAALVRREFRSRRPATDQEWEECTQLGFDALRELGYVAGVSEHMAELPAKDLRPRVDPRLWEGMSASPRWNVRPGRVLVAHPRTPNESWHHAVVLLLEYSPEQGALGLLINRPESLLKRSGTGTPPSYRSYIGGSTKGWYWLSRFRLPAAQTAPRSTGNVYYGSGNKGPKWEIELENTRAADESAVRFFWGCERWAPRALERQLDQGIWFLADVSTDVLFPRHPLFSHRFTEERNAARRSQFWGRLLELMGGPYAPLSRFAMLTDDAHERLLHRGSVCCGGNDFLFHQHDNDFANDEEEEEDVDDEGQHY